MEGMEGMESMESMEGSIPQTQIFDNISNIFTLFYCFKLDPILLFSGY